MLCVDKDVRNPDYSDFGIALFVVDHALKHSAPAARTDRRAEKMSGTFFDVHIRLRGNATHLLLRPD